MRSYIRGEWANAAVDLLDELKRLGIRGVAGYATRPAKRNNTLSAHVDDPKDIPRVPTEFNGYKVKAVYHPPTSN